MTRNTRRVVVGVSVIVAVLLVAAVVYSASRWLDPGDKGDTSSDLVTPTLASASARVFDVSPVESEVEFGAKVGALEVDGVFPVRAGTITLEPVGDELRVLVRLEINVDAADTGMDAVTAVLRGAMKTGDYPIAFYVATSRELVPVTEEEIAFVLEGELQVNNVKNPHEMAVQAQLVGGEMWAVATSNLDLGQHNVEFPALIDSSTITLTAHLQAYEDASSATGAARETATAEADAARASDAR